MKLRTLGPNATTRDVLAELDYVGAVVVKDVIGEETLERFNSEVMPYVGITPMGLDNFSARRQSAKEHYSRARRPVGL